MELIMKIAKKYLFIWLLGLCSTMFGMDKKVALRGLIENSWPSVESHISKLPKGLGIVRGLHKYTPGSMQEIQGYKVYKIDANTFVVVKGNPDTYHQVMVVKKTKRGYGACKGVKSCFAQKRSTDSIKLLVLKNLNNAEIKVLYDREEKAAYSIQFVDAGIVIRVIVTQEQGQMYVNTIYPEIVLDILEERKFEQDVSQICAELNAHERDKVENVTEVNKNLVTALKDQDLDKLSEALLGGADVNQIVDKEINTALIVAAQKGWYEGFELLLQHNAQVAHKGKQGNVFDCIVLQEGKKESEIIFLALLQEAPGEMLIAAVKQAKKELIEQILTIGVDVNYQDTDGYTALMHCANTGREPNVAQTTVAEIAALLLDAGADLEITEKSGRSAHHFFNNLSKQSKLPGVLQIFNEKKEQFINAADKNINANLSWAVACNNRYAVKQLLNDIQDTYVIGIALAATKDLVIRELLQEKLQKLQEASQSQEEKEAEIRSKNQQEEARKLAEQEDYFNKLSARFATRLLGASVDNELSIDELKALNNRPNRSLLHEAVRAGSLPLVQELLEKRIATIFQTDHENNNALEVAYSHNKIEVFEYLMELSQVDPRSVYGLVRLCNANDNNQLLADRLIEKVSAQEYVHVLLQEALTRQEIDIFEKIISWIRLKQQIKILDQQDKNGMTILMLAAQAENEKAVQILIDNGVSVDIKNNEGKSAFSYAKKDSVVEKILNEKRSVLPLNVISNNELPVQENGNKKKKKQPGVIKQEIQNNTSIKKAGLDYDQIIDSIKNGTFTLPKNKNFNVDYIDQEGKSLVIHAIESNNNNSLNILLKNKANIFVKRKTDGANVLIIALKEGSEACYKLLITFCIGQDPSKVSEDILKSKDDEGKTFFHHMTNVNKDVKSMTLAAMKVIQERCEKSQYDDNATKDLAKVIKEKKYNKVKEILERKADPNYRTVDNSTGLITGAAGMKPDIAKEFVSRGVNINAQNDTGDTALMVCVHNKNVELLRYLLSLNVNVNAKNKQGLTALMAACGKSDNIQCVKLLLESGAAATINYQENISKKTALILAAEKGAAEIIKELLAFGADIELETSVGSTALGLVSECGYYNIAKILLEAGANPNVRAANGISILDIAVQEKHGDIVQLLLEYNADPNMDNGKYQAPLIKAAQRGSFEIIQMLLAKGADIEAVDTRSLTALMYACQNGHIDVVKYLLSVCTAEHINKRNDQGATALMLAVNNNRLGVVELLLNKKADPNISSRSGTTALIIATCQGYIDLLEELLKKGANINYQEPVSGNTALILAATSKKNKVYQLLVQNNADTKIKNNNGQTALDLIGDKKSNK